MGTLAALALLLLGPGLAFHRLSSHFPFTWGPGYLLCVSLITYALYASDKKRAKADAWRISEFTLHFMELIGGWPAAFIAQRRLRHKSSKRSYQAAFWVIVAAYEFTAFDFLFNWAACKGLLALVEKQFA